MSSVRFPFKNRKEYLLVVITNGELYILETQNDTWLEFQGGLSDIEGNEESIESELDELLKNVEPGN